MNLLMAHLLFHMEAIASWLLVSSSIVFGMLESNKVEAVAIGSAALTITSLALLVSVLTREPLFSGTNAVTGRR